MRSWRSVRLQIVVLVVLMGMIGYIYHIVSASHRVLLRNVEQIYIDMAANAGQQIERMLVRQFDHNLIEKIGRDKHKARMIESSLSLIQSPTFRYIYILYLDQDGHFRYLMDATQNPDERGYFAERFGKTDPAWFQAYREGKPKVILDKSVKGLWGTYLYPIVQNGKSEAMVVIDFASTFPQKIAQITRPIEKSFYFVFALIILFALLIVWQIFLNYRIEKDSMIDPLTRTFNRKFLRQFIQEINPKDFHIILFDIDHFKAVNDTYGHKVGDMVLQHIAKTIQRGTRPEDILVRYGGEEFLLFVKCQRDVSVLAMAERLRRSIQNTPLRINGKEIKTTISMGICERPENFKNVGDAIKKADEMLYVAKRGGRNLVVMDSIYENLNVRKVIEIDKIRQALEDDRITCYYQPIYNANDDTIYKYEALVRMIGEGGEVFTPIHFLQEIHQTSLYADITKRVMQIVFDTIEKERVAISINLNISDLLDNTLFRDLMGLLLEHRALARYLTIELLEYETTEDTLLAQRIDTIRELDVKLAIDDFGSGYANFSLFRDLTIDQLKIDGSIVRNVAQSKTARTIVYNIFKFSQDMNVEAIAEYVHDEATYRTLQMMGIVYMQGFYISEPQPTIVKTINFLQEVKSKKDKK